MPYLRLLQVYGMRIENTHYTGGSRKSAHLAIIDHSTTGLYSYVPDRRLPIPFALKPVVELQHLLRIYFREHKDLILRVDKDMFRFTYFPKQCC